MANSAPAPDTADRPLSAAEYARLPADDAYRDELVRGRLVRSPWPQPLHGRLLTRLARLLDEVVERAGTGAVLTEVGALLERDPDTVRGPDLAYYSHARIPATGYAPGYWGPPDLAVEITSPTSRASDTQDRVMQYLDAGVRLLWIVDPPTRSVTVYAAGGVARVLGSGEVLDGGDVLPGLRLPLATLFAP